MKKFSVVEMALAECKSLSDEEKPTRLLAEILSHLVSARTAAETESDVVFLTPFMTLHYAAASLAHDQATLTNSEKLVSLMTLIDAMKKELDVTYVIDKADPVIHALLDGAHDLASILRDMLASGANGNSL